MLTDVLSGLRLEIFPTIAMVFFLIAFAAVAIKILLSPGSEMREAANVPLEDEESKEATP